MPAPGDVVATAHGPGRVTQVHARVQEPDGTLGYLVTAELEQPYTGENHQVVRRLEAIVPVEQG